MIADKVALRGFTGYRAQLDNKSKHRLFLYQTLKKDYPIYTSVGMSYSLDVQTDCFVTKLQTTNRIFSILYNFTICSSYIMGRKIGPKKAEPRLK